MRRPIFLGAVVMFLAASGCEFTIPSGRFECQTDDQCPPQQRCVHELCVTTPVSGDAGMDAGMDADAGAVDGACGAGMHSCDGRCVSDRSPLSCGTSCTPCEAPAGGTATCDGIRCGGECSGSDVLCAGACIPADAPCDNTCPAGTHDCAGLCTSDTSVNSCGVSCDPCPVPTNAIAATCDGTACGLDCADGFHVCDSACVSNSSTDSCGPTSCTPCPPGPSGSSATCDGTSCGWTCDAELVECDGACIPSTSCCTDSDCIARPNAVATCDGGTCSYPCQTGFVACDDTCIADTDCCTAADCPSPPDHATATCDDSHACGFACDPGYVAAGAFCDVAAPRPLAPWSNAYASSHQPEFRWVLPPGVSGAHIEICRDRACATVVDSSDVTGDRYTPASPLPPGVLFWRLRGILGGTTGSQISPPWPFVALQRANDVKISFGIISDFDNDGFADLVVGDDRANSPALGDGRFYTYHGSSTEIETSATQTDAGPVGSRFGSSVASVGDVNGDGFTDIAVGAFGDDDAWWYRGSASGILINNPPRLTPTGATSFGRQVQAAGDLNGDGYADIVVGSNSGAYVFYGGGGMGPPTSGMTTVPPPSGSTRFGESAGGAGDVDGDGYADLLVSDPPRDRVYLFLGGPDGVSTIPDQTLMSPVASAAFGNDVHAAGDVNGDGRGDVIIGGFMMSSAWVYTGNASGLNAAPAATLTGNGSFGFSVAGAGDMDGDGRTEVVVTNFSGTLGFVFLGTSTGTSITPIVITSGNSGWRCAGASDIDGDGFSDIVIAAPSGSAVVQTVHGDTTIPTSPTTTITNDDATGRFGISVSM